MANEVATMQSISDKVKERIKVQFADLIPDEMFDNMVKSAVQEYLRDNLTNVVKEEGRLFLGELVRQELSKPEWQGSWVHGYSGMGQMMSGELISKVLKEHAPDLVNALFSGMMQQMIQHLRNSPRPY